MSDHGHGGGDHAPKAHAPKASGGGGGGGGGLTLTFGNGVLLFFGAPLLVLAFGWMGAHRELVSLVLFVIINVVFLLLPFWMFRILWTIPILKHNDKHKTKLANTLITLILRIPAITLASWCLLYLWWQAQYELWHPERGQPFVGHFVDHIPLAILLAVGVWIGMNWINRIIERFFQWLTGIPGWPEPHTGEH